jgi:hypothetical protein
MKQLGSFKDLQIFNLNKIVGGKSIECQETCKNGQSDYHAVTCYSDYAEARKDGCDSLRCADPEYNNVGISPASTAASYTNASSF